jgi:hypothetical protein
MIKPIRDYTIRFVTKLKTIIEIQLNKIELDLINQIENTAGEAFANMIVITPKKYIQIRVNENYDPDEVFAVIEGVLASYYKPVPSVFDEAFEDKL